MGQISVPENTSKLRDNLTIQTIVDLEDKCRQLQQELHVQQKAAEMTFPVPTPLRTLDEHQALLQELEKYKTCSQTAEAQVIELQFMMAAVKGESSCLVQENRKLQEQLAIEESLNIWGRTTYIYIYRWYWMMFPKQSTTLRIFSWTKRWKKLRTWKRALENTPLLKEGLTWVNANMIDQASGSNDNKIYIIH